MSGLTYLMWKDLRARPARTTVLMLGMALGVAVLVSVVALGLGVRQAVLGEVVKTLPLDTVEVLPRTMDLGIFKLDTDKLFGGQGLDPKSLEAIRGLPQVEAAYPKLEIPIPMGARGGARLFGRALYTDLFMTALPVELVQEESPEFADIPDVLPVVVSTHLLEIYNRSVAPALRTPKLTSSTLEGFEFDVHVGRSLMLGGRGASRGGTERARIMGTSRYAMRLGVTVPLETGRRLLETYSENQDESYVSVIVRAKSAADVPDLVAGVRSLGLDVDETANRTSDLLTAGTLLASLVGALVLLLAALNIAHSFFASLSERRRELAVMRAVGATRGHIVSVVLLQAIALGLGGGFLGVIAARLASVAADHFAGQLLPDFPFKPESFFQWPLWLWGLGMGLSVLTAILGAAWPAIRAAKTPVVRALAES